MKYCPKCKKLHKDNEEFCSECKKKRLVEITEKNTPVRVCKANGVDKERVRAALSDAGIPSDEMRVKDVSAHAVTGNDMSEATVLVPYQAYNKAYEICVGIGAIKPEDAEDISDELIYDIESKKETLDKDIEEFEDMPASKRTFVRIVSAILLVAMFCGLIWGFDYLLEFLKGLFR